MPRKKMKNVSAKVPPEVTRQISAHCIRTGQSRSEAIRNLLVSGLQKTLIKDQIESDNQLLRFEMHKLFALLLGNMPGDLTNSPEEVIEEVVQMVHAKLKRIPR